MVVGTSGNAAVEAVFGLLFHEVLAIIHLLQLLTNARLVDHLETTIQHDLSVRNGLIFDRNLALLLDFRKAQDNFLIIQPPTLPLYSFVAKQVVSDTTKMRLLNALQHGQAAQLNNWQEEADSRVIPHVEWAIKDGCEKAVVISHDTDTIAILLHDICVFKVCGLQELWAQYGTEEKRRMIPLHVLHLKL